ncbi:DEAD/DEAH box helicase [Desulforamulus profundi]|uniref:DEAD/DEAH box helicase n=1 Tax=Desulforamulus profundi TaxID=1383067 RepID=A0A2C6L1Z9_9FIRM|nr:DEAD/DEAH box helicase [Desulforamulus profundi]PHJ37611.1 DEAD/DEAH box helicase [Desulforamulus profundi]
MKPERRSQLLLGVTRSKAKMYEYGVPEEHHIKIIRDPSRLFTLAIGLLGDHAARTNSEEVKEIYLKELQNHLQFSAHFFDAFLQSRLNADLKPYLLLLGAASYFLCDLPGSSSVLANRLGKDHYDLECLGLEDLLRWLLQRDFSTYFDESEGIYAEYINGISQWIVHYFENGNGEDTLFELTNHLRKAAYVSGTPRQLLFADVISAVVKKLYMNSGWYCLPRYTDLSVEQWQNALKKDTFVRELWPAQHLLGEHGVFRGKSAVIQMPTSAGKTKATEIIIRSAFLSERTSLAVIVAPFRSLCHEIRNSLIEAFQNESVNIDELSDVFQFDFEIEELLGRKQILIVTPEKLIYVLRHVPELAQNIGLLIYDEGHMFDNGTRGITYELLLTSLKSMVPKGIQTVLISAVISNAEAVGNWLNKEDFEVVSGTNLIPTYRTVAFASWLDQLGRLEFVTTEDPNNVEFFVPRIIEAQQLQLRIRERKQRLFPEKNDGQTIALYLGLKLVPNGSVAVFVGKKSTASSLCEKVVDAYNRGLAFAKPIDFSDQDEISRLYFLHECNLGAEATATQGASHGIFTHHGNIPQGIRLSVEHAMKEGLARFVICTSTLAQGVNLPIRYLIVTSIYHGTERIKVRDFHNLIGRAGRSGMHTEGSIIFADPFIFDKRNVWKERWRWWQVNELLNPDNSEPCASTLLSIFEPLYSDNYKNTIPMEPLSFVQYYIQDPSTVDTLPGRIASDFVEMGFTKEGLQRQITWKMNIISSIESYLMAHWDDTNMGLKEDEIAELAEGTLAYFLAEDEQRELIVELFKLLASHIAQRVPEVAKRKLFGKTLYGVWTSITIEDWVRQHIEELIACNSHDELLVTLWPILYDNIQNITFKKCDRPEVLINIASSWINGEPYYKLYEIIKDSGARLISKTRLRHFDLENVIDICDNALAYGGTLVLGAIVELVELIYPENNDNIISNLQELQKRLKYGLPYTSAIMFYELGFADRIIAMDLSLTVDVSPSPKNVIIRKVKQNVQAVRELLRKYPSYFNMVLNNILG